MLFTFEPQHDKTNKMTSAPSKDSDQPGYPPSLIRGVTVHMKKDFVLSYPFSAQRRLWSDFVMPRLIWVYTEQTGHFVLLCCGSFVVVALSVVYAGYYIWAATWQNQQNECAPSEDSDQPGHPPSLIRVLAVCMKEAWVLNYSLSTQRRLWSDWADAQADLSLRWVHTHFVGFVMLWLIYSAQN